MNSSLPSSLLLSLLPLIPADPVSALEFTVEENEDFVVGDSATAWVQRGNHRPEFSTVDCFAVCLHDDEGFWVLEEFAATVEGLGECLEHLFQQQDECDEEQFLARLKQVVAS